MADRYWVGDGGNWNNTDHWSTTSGGSGGASLPTSADNVYFDDNSFTTTGQTVTMSATSNCLDMDWSTSVNSPTFNQSCVLNIYGSLTFISEMTFSSSSTVSFSSTAVGKIITTTGKIFNTTMSFNGSGGWTLQDDLTVRWLFLSNGTFNSFNCSITCLGFIDCSGSSVRNINLSGSIIITPYWVGGGNNLTFDAGTSTIIMTGNTKTFTGGGLNYNNVEFQGSPIAVTGSNTFNELKLTAGKTVNITDGTTQTVITLIANGTLNNLITIQSTSVGSQATISSTNNQTVNFCLIRDMIATGGGNFYAYDSINAINDVEYSFLLFYLYDTPSNTGWIFVLRASANLTSTSTITATLGFTFSLITTLKSGIYRQRIKIELLRSTDEIPYAVIDTYLENSSSSNLNIVWQNGVRRSCNVVLTNLSTNPYYISDDSLFVNSKFKLWLGLEDEYGNIGWYSQGVFLMDDPQITSNFSQSELILKGVDKFGAYTTIRGELDATYQIPAGTDISSAIKSILTDLVNDPIPPIIHSSLVDKVTPYTIVKEIGSKIGDVLIELASINSDNIYYNEHGQLVVEPDEEDTTKGSQWDFTTTEFQYLGGSLTYKFSELFNSCKVISSNINGSTYSYLAQNNNLLSPVSIPNLGFERVFTYKSDVLDSEVRCKDLAIYILKRKTSMQSEIIIESIPMYHLNPADIISLTDSNLKLNEERYFIKSISIPLNMGATMSLNCVKSQDLVLN